jgi:hypothetical protein
MVQRCRRFAGSRSGKAHERSSKRLSDLRSLPSCAEHSRPAASLSRLMVIGFVAFAEDRRSAHSLETPSIRMADRAAVKLARLDHCLIERLMVLALSHLPKIPGPRILSKRSHKAAVKLARLDHAHPRRAAECSSFDALSPSPLIVCAAHGRELVAKNHAQSLASRSHPCG